MDGRRFDDLTRALGKPGSRREVLKGLLGAGLAIAGVGRFAGSAAGSQVSQIQCGNVACANNIGICNAGCVCCLYRNSRGSVTNSRCRPPGSCSPGESACPPGRFLDPQFGCVECLTDGNCPGPVDGDPCLVSACIDRTCGVRPGNAGAACGQTTCANGAVTSYACDPAGSCAANAPVPCDPYVCAGDGSGCLASCAGDGDCLGSAFCNVGACVGDLPAGAACAGNGQCLSGFCTDGVCCDVAACGTCQACNVPGSLGTCARAAGGTCTPADTCFATGFCTETGVCVPNGGPRDCEARECQQGFCQDGECRYTPVDGGSCGTGGECFSKVCSGGSCVEQSDNEGQSCGDGGTECNPKLCQGGSCLSLPDSANLSTCTGGTCYGGQCCVGGTVGEESCGVQYGVCCADKPCCGTGCCDECFSEPSASGGQPTFICCPQTSLCPPNDPNAPGCCYSNETCVPTGPGGYACVRNARVCDGQICDGDCCGGDCCEDGQFCNGGACVPVPTTSCLTGANCGPNLACVGVTEVLETNGPEEPTIVTRPGFCCPANRACTYRIPRPPDGEPSDQCLPFGQRCGGSLLGQSCSNASYIECGGSCDTCSPRSSRLRR